MVVMFRYHAQSINSVFLCLICLICVDKYSAGSSYRESSMDVTFEKAADGCKKRKALLNPQERFFLVVRRVWTGEGFMET